MLAVVAANALGGRAEPTIADALQAHRKARFARCRPRADPFQKGPRLTYGAAVIPRGLSWDLDAGGP